MKLSKQIIEMVTSIGAGSRSLSLIVPKVTVDTWTGGLHISHWGFTVPYGMREALDVKFTPRIERKHYKVGYKVPWQKRLNIKFDSQVKRKNALLSTSNIRILKGHKPVVEQVSLNDNDYMYLTFCMTSRKKVHVWTQGGLISFKRGDTIPSNDGRYLVQVQFAESMGLVAKTELVDGKYDTKMVMDDGFVRYQLFEKVKGEAVRRVNEGKLTQLEFLAFLIDGVPKPASLHSNLVDSLQTFNSPDITLSFGDGVVFSGDFGNRLEIYEELAVRKGMALKSSISKLCKVVVIANEPSQGWKHGAFGNKIEKAIDMRNSGADILFLCESSYLGILSTMADVPPSARWRKRELPKKLVESRQDDGVVVLDNGIRIALTGTFERMSRKELEELLAEKYNFTCKKGITKDTEFLVVGDKRSDMSSKLENAQKMGVSVVTESEFFDSYPV